MKIISKYSDYYDSAMGQGIDTSLVYVREGALDDAIKSYIYWDNTDGFSSSTLSTETSRYFGKILNPEYFSRSWRYRNTTNLGNSARRLVAGICKKMPNYSIYVNEINVIGFCGKTYVTYELSFTSKTRAFLGPPHFRIDEHRASVTVANQDNKFFKMLDKKDKKNIVIGEADNIFRGNIDDIFLHFNCPVFLLRLNSNYDIELVRNPILKDVGFPSILNPYTAFQEISMYMGSVFANTEDSMENISDKSMSEAKGFDKWSFRKLPTKIR